MKPTKLLPLTVATLVCVQITCAPPMVHYPDADGFARHLFELARSGSASEWGRQLTRARREQGGEYITRHFESWSRLLTELEQGVFGGDLRVAEFRESEGALEFRAEDQWHHLIRITMEDGGWKINQD